MGDHGGRDQRALSPTIFVSYHHYPRCCPVAVLASFELGCKLARTTSLLFFRFRKDMALNDPSSAPQLASLDSFVTDGDWRELSGSELVELIVGCATHDDHPEGCHQADWRIYAWFLQLFCT